MLRGILLLAFGAAGFAGIAEGRIEVVGAPEIVFDWSRDHCPTDPADPEGWDIPDSPPRAIRAADGTVRLFAVHFTNLALVGAAGMASFRHPDCRPMMRSERNPDPAKFADHQWLVSPYTLDGRHVFSLVHEEYHGWSYHKNCGARQPEGWRACSYFSTASATSADGGATFAYVPAPAGLLATPPTRFSDDMGAGGISDSTNIVRSPKDHRFYFLARAMAFKNQRVGICLFRAAALKPGAWRAWDGKGFRVRAASPYDDPPQPCAPVLATSDAQYSVTYNTVLGRFLLVGRNNLEVFYRQSDDLIHWSPQQHLLDLPLSGDGKGKAVASYYSVLDPASPSDNFDISGGRPYLYFVRWHVRGGGIVNSERDIDRMPLEISGVSVRAARP